MARIAVRPAATVDVGFFVGETPVLDSGVGTADFPQINRFVAVENAANKVLSRIAGAVGTPVAS